jgi:hypothetical protein
MNKPIALATQNERDRSRAGHKDMAGGSRSYKKEQRSMEARTLRAVFTAVLLLVSMGARYRSANFVVETPDPRLAQQFAEAAEKYRGELAQSWLGEELPNWSQPCPLKVKVGPHIGAGGATTFTFDRGEVFGWHMEIQGSAERVLDSVLPHEITHMIYASHFRRPLPRWADEGGATSVEHYSERNKQRAMLDQFLRTGRGIAFNTMFSMTEYPADILPLYAEGYSTAEYLIQNGGRRKYIAFLDEGLKDRNWSGALQQNYGISDLSDLQQRWLAWVKQGSPLKPQQTAPAADASPDMLAADARLPRPDPNLIIRTRDREAASAAPKSIPAVSHGTADSRALAASKNPPADDAKVLPLNPVVPVPKKSGAVASNAKPSVFDVAASGGDVPYTPGSTIAVSRLSIPSTGWRSAYTMPSSSSLAAATTLAKAPSEPYSTKVGRPQPLESPVQTTMWR